MSICVTIGRMEKPPYIPNSDEYGELQRFVEALYASETLVDNLDVQVISALAAHGWTQRFGTVE